MHAAVVLLLVIAMYPASAAADTSHATKGIGDPVVQLGQGRAGRARLVDESQDDLTSDSPFVELAPASRWSRDGIACAVHGESIRCTNSVGDGFTMSPRHVRLF